MAVFLFELTWHRVNSPLFFFSFPFVYFFNLRCVYQLVNFLLALFVAMQTFIPPNNHSPTNKLSHPPTQLPSPVPPQVFFLFFSFFVCIYCLPSLPKIGEKKQRVSLISINPPSLIRVFKKNLVFNPMWFLLKVFFWSCWLVFSLVDFC